MSDWLYQIRIKVSEQLSQDLRGVQELELSQAINEIADENGTRIVCTFDAFAEYCEEAENNGIEHYELYHWTKSTIENPEKKSKHLKSGQPKRVRCFVVFHKIREIIKRRVTVFQHRKIVSEKWIKWRTY